MGSEEGREIGNFLNDDFAINDSFHSKKSNRS